MRLLITGGAGFIGSHLCDRLISDGHEVVVLDNLCSGGWDNLAHHDTERLTRVEGDVRDESWAAKVGEIDVIYHLAALISGHDSLHEPESYLSVNVGGLFRVLAVAKAKRARIVFASSSTVYGSQERDACRETDLPTPLTVYALTKLMGEHLLALYAPMYGISHASLRLFNVYGPRQSPNHPYANVTCKFSHAAATNEGVNLYGDGEQSRDFVYVDDVVRAFLLVGSESDAPVYNVGTGQETSIVELLSLVRELTRNSVEATTCPPWPNDIRSIRADIGRIRKAYDFVPKTSLRDGLRATIDSFKQHA
jgi:UDP-glucose 4-epimerase